jgi:hypothetical protein
MLEVGRRTAGAMVVPCMGCGGPVVSIPEPSRRTCAACDLRHRIQAGMRPPSDRMDPPAGARRRPVGWRDRPPPAPRYRRRDATGPAVGDRPGKDHRRHVDCKDHPCGTYREERHCSAGRHLVSEGDADALRGVWGAARLGPGADAEDLRRVRSCLPLPGGRATAGWEGGSHGGWGRQRGDPGARIWAAGCERARAGGSIGGSSKPRKHPHPPGV